MKRLVAFLLSLIVLPLWVADCPAWGLMGVTGAPTTNYCRDANAQLCLYMNNNGGNETDRSANAYTFTQSASDNIPTSATVPPGYSGTSRDFVAADTENLSCLDNVCTNLDINGASAKISMVAWIRNDIINNAATQRIVFKLATSNIQYGFGIVGTATNVWKGNGFVSADGTTVVNISSTTTNYASGAWHHITFVSNGVDLRLYVDGVIDCTPIAHATGIYNGNATIYVGSSASGQYQDGLLDEIAIFNRALSATEIAAIYMYGITGNRGGSD